MHFGDYTFIFLLALVLFGPKKLPEIGKQLGKLLAEFRRASNEFKFQIQEELRNMEEEERRKKLADEQAQRGALADQAALPASTTPTILPPSTGDPVSASYPYATPVEPAEPTPVSPGVEESTGEVIVDPPAPTDPPALLGTGTEPDVALTPALTPVVPSDPDPPVHLDLTSPANVTFPEAEPAHTAHHD
jgi:sec-independent protein translocase protein TatB